MGTKGIARLLLVTLLAFGCGGDAETEAEAGAEGDVAADSVRGPMGAIQQTVNQADRARSIALGAETRSHLNVLEAAGGDELVPMVPAHRQRVEGLITQLEPDMTANATWTATADSVRQDLTRMQGMTASELESLMDAHAGRVRRLIELHEQRGAPRM